MNARMLEDAEMEELITLFGEAAKRAL